jgi:hypothetical protein
MRMTVSVEFTDGGNRITRRRFIAVTRNPAHAASGDIGLTLVEAKTLLGYVQHEFVAAQADDLVERARTCERCGHRLATKDVERRPVHTLFGRISLSAIRLLSCGGDGSKRRALSPLHGWLSRCSNELRYQAARWGSEHSYREAAAILQELLPVDWRFGHVRVREAVLRAGARLEKEADLPEIPEYLPFGTEEPPATMSFDGGYVRRTRKGPRRNFEILTGAIQKRRKIKVFATVYADRAKLPARLKRFAASAGVRGHAPINVMTDGAVSLLRLKPMLPLKTRFVLDYFHVAMKLRHIDQSVGRIPPIRLSQGGSVFELYDRSTYLRAYIWTGRAEKVEESIENMLALLDRVKALSPDDSEAAQIVAGHVLELWGYLRTNERGVINYQAWRRSGRRISTSGVEATVSRLIGRRLGEDQHMCWTKRGAHLLLQVRCALLNGELLPVFRRWYPEVGKDRTTFPWLSSPQHS